ALPIFRLRARNLMASGFSYSTLSSAAHGTPGNNPLKPFGSDPAATKHAPGPTCGDESDGSKGQWEPKRGISGPSDSHAVVPGESRDLEEEEMGMEFPASLHGHGKHPKDEGE